MDNFQHNRRLPVELNPLPMDMITETLRYLTVRPLVRMRLVNNDWNRLILSGEFGVVHRNQMTQDNEWVYFFLAEAHYRPLRMDGRFIYYRSDRLHGGGPNQIDILCTCSGLVVCIRANNDMYLWNPMTRIATPIPPQPIVCPPTVQTGRVSFSLGHNVENDDFILVRITIFGGPVARNEVMLFSRNWQTWIRGPDFPHSPIVVRSGVPISGHLHWLLNLGDEGHAIAVLSMSTLTYTLMNFDPHGNWPTAYTHLDRLGNDCLCLYTSLTPRGGTYRLSFLVDYNDQSSWNTIMITLDDAICGFAYYVNLQPLHFVDRNHTQILFRVNPVGSFGIFDTMTMMFEPLIGREAGVLGQVSVLRILQTLERPTRPFFWN